jgi:hypothetical protein
VQKKQTFLPTLISSADMVASWVAGATRFLKKGSWTSKNVCFARPLHFAMFDSFVPIGDIFFIIIS